MTTKIFALLCLIGFAAVCIAQDQSPTPAQSPEPTKHRAHKKAETTASAADTAASPSTAASPAASPKAKRARKQATAAAAASPSPSASPKFNVGDLFKPRNSTTAASPAAAAPAPAKNTGTHAATKAPAAGGGQGLVWVNTESHVYHKEGSRFYGTTKKGQYMTEAEAVKAGNKAAHN